MKKRIILAAAVLALILTSVAGAAGVTQSDPLISLRYLTETFLPTLLGQAEERLSPLDDAYQTATDDLEERAEGYLAQAAGSGTGEGRYSARFVPDSYGLDDVFTLPSGAGFLLTDGYARVDHDGGVVDVTTGGAVASGSPLTAGHRYLVAEDTTASFTVTSGAATAAAEGSYTLSLSASSHIPFSDVSRDHWYFPAVTFVYEHGLFSGTAADTFSPDLNITRGMVVTVLYQLAGRPAASGSVSFTDVPGDAYYAQPVAWASSHGVVAGMGDGTFAPDNNITREQLAVMLYAYARNIAGSDASARGDLERYGDRDQVSSYAVEALSWAVGAGVITGMDASTLDPGGTATRAQAAAMLRVLSDVL